MYLDFGKMTTRNSRSRNFLEQPTGERGGSLNPRGHCVLVDGVFDHHLLLLLFLRDKSRLLPDGGLP